MSSKWGLYGRMFGFGRPYLGLFLFAVAISLITVLLEAVYLWVPASVFNTLFNPQVAPLPRPEFALRNLNAMLKYLLDAAVRSGDPLVTLQLMCVLMAAACALKNVAPTFTACLSAS